jgi:hypothetical protein
VTEASPSALYFRTKVNFHPQADQIVARSRIFSYINLHNVAKFYFSQYKTMQTQDRNDVTKVGFTPQAENWNGRLAMIGFLAAVIIELTSGEGVLHFWGLM